MKIVVVEGVDNSGKSTLIRYLVDQFKPIYDFIVQASEGPPHYPGEMKERVTRYLELARTCDTVFDRHPCVSQIIYGRLHTHVDPIPSELMEAFYQSKPVFVYCDPGNRRMSGHTRNTAVDTERHLSQVNANYDRLLADYRAWAVEYAHIIYRIGDERNKVIRAVGAML